MNKSLVFVVAIVAASLWVPTTSAVAQQGEDLGACLGLNLKGIDLCIDGVDSLTCELFCDFNGAPSEGGQTPICAFVPGETCSEQDVVWDGACDNVDIFQPVPDVCLLLNSPQTGQSQSICEGADGTWLGDGSVCGGVPALPKAGYAALALVLLVGTLTLLSLHGRS